MPKTEYVNVKDVTRLQEIIVNYLTERARINNTAISKKDLVLEMKDKGIKTLTTVSALKSLLKKGYIRRASSISNRTYYVLCRTI